MKSDSEASVQSPKANDADKVAAANLDFIQNYHKIYEKSNRIDMDSPNFIKAEAIFPSNNEKNHDFNIQRKKSRTFTETKVKKRKIRVKKVSIEKRRKTEFKINKPMDSPLFKPFLNQNSVEGKNIISKERVNSFFLGSGKGRKSFLFNKTKSTKNLSKNYGDSILNYSNTSDEDENLTSSKNKKLHDSLLVNKKKGRLKTITSNLVKVLDVDSITGKRLIYDLGKNHISISRRQTIYKNDNRHILRVNSRLSNSRIKPSNIEHMKKLKEISRNRRMTDSEKTILQFRLLHSQRIKKFWRRVRVLCLVIQTTIFLRKELMIFGINPSQDLINNFRINEDRLLPSYFCETQIIVFQNNNPVKNLPPFIIIPKGWKYDIWNYFRFVFVTYFVFIYPLREGFYYQTHFQKKDAFYELDIIVEFLFFIDFLLSFFTAFVEEENSILETSTKLIVYNYLTSWMLFDLAALIPFFLFEFSNQLAKFFCLLFKMLRVIKFCFDLNSQKKISKVQEFLNIQGGMIKLLYFMINSIILCYTFACLWGYSARFDDRLSNWVIRSGSLDNPPLIKFLKALYFSYTVFITVGYGDINAFTTIEIILVCIWMYICALYYTFTLTSLSNIFLGTNKNLLKLHNKCNIVEEIFVASKLKHLISKTTTYLKRNEDKKELSGNSLKDIKKLIEEVSMNIRLEIADSIFNGKIRTISFFNSGSVSNDFIGNILPLLQSDTFPKFTTIYSIDEAPGKIYFLSEGSVSFLNDDGIVWQTLKQGSYFGDIEVFRKSFRDSTTIAISDTFVLTLTQSIIWEDIHNLFSDEFNALLKNMIKRYKFYCEIQNIIQTIIEEGKDLFSNELAKLVKAKLNIPLKSFNYNKIYFGFGILDRLNQLKIRKETDLNDDITYNFKAIENIFNQTVLNDNDKKDGMNSIRRANRLKSEKSLPKLILNERVTPGKKNHTKNFFIKKREKPTIHFNKIKSPQSNLSNKWKNDKGIDIQATHINLKITKSSPISNVVKENQDSEEIKTNDIKSKRANLELNKNNNSLLNKLKNYKEVRKLSFVETETKPGILKNKFNFSPLKSNSINSPKKKFNLEDLNENISIFNKKNEELILTMKDVNRKIERLIEISKNTIPEENSDVSESDTDSTFPVVSKNMMVRKLHSLNNLHIKL